MRVVTAAQMREIDRRAIEERSIPGADLMERAAAAIVQAVIDIVEGSNILVLCGRGNNGGDGYCTARLLASYGYSAMVVPVLGSEGMQGDAYEAFRQLPTLRAPIVPYEGETQLRQLLEEAEGVVDAMLGTGSTLPLRDPLPAVVRAVNASGLPVIAADIPTGLDADSGAGDPVVRAACTVTVGLPKKGMLAANGVRHCGNVRVEPINFPRELLDDPSFRHSTVTLPGAGALLPPRPIDGHKGTFGSVAVFAGSAGMPGAAVLCGTGALRSGAGLVRMHLPSAVRPHAIAALPGALFPVDNPEAVDALAPLGGGKWKDGPLGSCRAAVIGPGIGTEDSQRALLEEALAHFPGTLVIDADALNILAAHPGLQKHLGKRTLLTPHPGELARLLGISADAVQADRWGKAEQAAEKFGCTVLLKGFGSLVASPEGEVFHVPSGNTGLARGGSGDLLAGVIGGLLAQGARARDAAVLGSFVCGLAADILVREESPRGLTVEQIAGALPRAFREVEDAARFRHLPIPPPRPSEGRLASS